MTSYWHKVLAARVSRRRTMMAGAGGAAAAALLAACGGDGGEGGGGKVEDKSGLLSKVEDTTNQAKPGGTYVSALTQDVQGLDPYQVTTGSAHAPYSYSRLVIYKPGRYPDPPFGSPVDQDAAESWEISPDGTQVTFKLRSNVKFDPRPPTNGRQLTTADFKFSADKFHATGLSRKEWYNDLQSSSPVTTVTAVDARTLVVKLAFPVANLMWYFAFQRYLWGMPVEADGKFDPRADMRGSGPWRLTRWDQSQALEYERNDEWHLRKPFLDGISHPIITEYAARRAQLESGNLWSTNINAEDILSVKQSQPKLSLYADIFPTGRPAMLGFSWLPGMPFQDVRVRRATSMLLDRDLLIDVFYNVSKYESVGLPMDARWHSHFGAGEPPYWIDPKPENSKLGEGAAFFKYNVAEAKKMVQAAGVNMPIRIKGFSNGNPTNDIQAFTNQLNESGVYAIELEPLTRNDFNNNVFNGGGLHDGLAMSQGPGVGGDIDEQLTVRFNVGAAPQVMFREVFPWYKKIQDLIALQRRELDEKKRAGQLEELQKEMAMQMPAVPWPGAANGFSLAWPYFGNYNVFTTTALTAQTDIWPSYWLDASKKT